MDWLIKFEPQIRLLCFLGILIAMLIWERLSPRRLWQDSRAEALITGRRLSNLSISIINTLVLRLLPGIAAVNAAIWATEVDFGILNSLNWNPLAEIFLAVLVLDLLIYFQHRVFHAVPTLWRLHRMHHSDQKFDTTTAVRFHPVEIALSMVIKTCAVLLLGAPLAAVILFEVLLNGSALFNHGNVSLPATIDRWLRRVLVTPDMHRVHHSVIPRETDSNFGFCFSFWDRLFSTYRDQPEKGHDHMDIGLNTFQGTGIDRLDRLLAQPFHQPSKSAD